MAGANASSAEEVLLLSTNRTHVADGIAWLAEDHPMPAGTNWSQLLRAVVELAGTGEIGSRAVRRVVREAARSSVDTSKVIFNHSNLPSPSDFRAALDELLNRSGDGTLAGLTARGVLRAHYANNLAIPTLCLAAGVTYSDAIDWIGVSNDNWTSHHVTHLLDYVRELIDNTLTSPIPNSTPAKAVELLATDRPGWELMNEYIQHGVPYEVLLAQRAVGGAWLAHKNTTSSFPNIAAANALCETLDARSIDYIRAKTVGGDVRQTDLQHISAIPKKQIGLVVISDGSARVAVAFSSARDGGTARANGDGLMQIPQTDLPFALFLTGLGWAGRPETDRLARRFHGWLFTETTLDDLVACIEDAVVR